MRPFGLRANYLFSLFREALLSGAHLLFGQMSGASVSSRCGADGITRFRYVNNNSRASNATAHYCA